MTTIALNNLWRYLQGLALTEKDRKWLAGKLQEPTYHVDPYTISPSGDKFFADSRNVKAVENDIAAAHKPDAKFTRLETKEDNNMCKYKDTNLGIKKLDFKVKRGTMAAYLTDGREIIVPVSMFPDIKRLSRKQREDYMIMDDQYFSFEALSRIYSVKDLLRV